MEARFLPADLLEQDLMAEEVFRCGHRDGEDRCELLDGAPCAHTETECAVAREESCLWAAICSGTGDDCQSCEVGHA